MQTVKQTLKKTRYDQQDAYLALLSLNSQSNFENEISPAQNYLTVNSAQT